MGTLPNQDKINQDKIITFGCRLNACESDIIMDFVNELGLGDDYVIINSCSVTAEAERQLRQTIRKLQRDNPNVKIILTGCASEANPELYMSMDGVVGIISNGKKLSKDEYMKYAEQSQATVQPQSPMTQPQPDQSSAHRSSCKHPSQSCGIADDQVTHVQRQQPPPPKKVRSFLQIQNGCDQKCTYCLVRTVRGPNISFPKEQIVDQARKLLSKGHAEIALTGVNISAYGRDMSPPSDLASIIRYILAQVPELRRLRLSSLDPADISDDLINLIANEERILPHVHESIQSGDNMILKRMMRRHSREQVIETNRKILQARPDVVIGADIIVGFPTETDQMFQNTIDLLRDGNISLIHAFPFSVRLGTPAASMPLVDTKIVSERVKKIRHVADELLLRKMSEYVGKDVVIMAETDTKGKTNSFLQVQSTEELVPGTEYVFHCESVERKCLIGKQIEAITKPSFFR
jgi:threonylcarbamoyladenosine tRNA methylthiotransferase MtaB